MNSSLRTAFRRAAVRATLAPSVHNTQPWQLQLSPGGIGLYADPARRLARLDAFGRQLTVSCGCALFNARVSLAADGVPVRVDRRRDPLAPDLLAVLTPAANAEPDDGSRSRLDKYVDRRRSSRRTFTAEKVPEPVGQQLEAIGARHGVGLTVLTDPAAGSVLAEVLDRTRRIAELDCAYRDEWRAWSELSAEDFGAEAGDGRVAGTTLVISTDADDARCWLRAGETLQHLLLELTGHGYSTKLCSHVIEIPAVRAQLRNELGLPGVPQVLLSVGRSVTPDPVSRRRRLLEVITETVG